jgi:hypothetical protein
LYAWKDIAKALADEYEVCRATLFRGNGVVPVAHYFVGIGRGTTVQSVRRIAAG